MYGYVDGIDFRNMEAMKYWSFPKNYAHDKNQEIKSYLFGRLLWRIEGGRLLPET